VTFAQVKRHRTLLDRTVPGGWLIEQLPDSEYTTLRYTSPTRLCVVETIRPYADGKQWQHLSISYWDRLPSYADLVMVKRLWMGNDTTALQVFPPASRWVNVHSWCLHLWRCLSEDVVPDFRGPDGMI
jgi:hypothetical protein